MITKLITAIVALTIIASVTLAQRHQRLEVMHEMARLHGEINHRRMETWDLQVRIAQRTVPATLRDAIDRTGLVVEPITRLRADSMWRRSLIADAGHGRD